MSSKKQLTPLAPSFVARGLGLLLFHALPLLLLPPSLALAEEAVTPADAVPGADAGAEAEDRDEDAFFGGAPSESEEGMVAGGEASHPVSNSNASDGEGVDAVERRLRASLDEQEDPLAIGGQLYLRLDWSAPEKGYPETFEWQTPALLDLYLDVRPNERLRAFVKGRLSHDFTLKPGQTSLFGTPLKQNQALLDQLWVKWDIAHTLFLTVGRQPLRWGSGRFWNPTDFLNASFKDPLAVFDERLGLTLVKLHLPIESLGWNLYAIADMEGARSPEEVSGALRLEMLLGTTELTGSLALGKGEPLRLGLDLSSGLGPIDLRAEFALLHGVSAPYFSGTLDLATGQFPRSEDRSGEWIPRALLGAELGLNISEEDSLYLGAEAFYNGFGYDDASLYPWLLAQSSYRPFYTGRWYAGAYAMLPSPGRFDDLTLVLSGLGNLSDRSFLTRLDASLTVVTYLRLNVYAGWHFGKVGEFRFGMELPPVPAVPGLEQGLSVVPPLLELGFGLTLSL